ncbi:MAG TPA: hypothetical protein VG939_11325, partial [Caulobacteraceae bacterium]|nr:hypothetical protein [Caulobacteraceae bacterium]
MKRWARGLVVLAVLALAVIGAAPAAAHFNKGEVDYAFAERQLCYTLQAQVRAHERWPGWIEKAVAGWNAVSARTGWSFRPCKPGEPADVWIGFAEGNGESAGGGFAEDRDKAWHRSETLKERHYDLKLNPDVEGLRAGAAIVKGGDHGWATDGATTLDPVLVVMHELTHAMRLTHEPAEGWNDGRPGSKFYFERPVGAGLHAGVPSADDLAQTHKAAIDGKPPANFHYPAPKCFADEAARARAVSDLGKLIVQFEENRDRAQEGLTAGGLDEATIKGLYAVAKQAVSNLEAARDALKALEDIPLCPPPEKTSTGERPDAGSHGLTAPHTAGAAFGAA